MAPIRTLSRPASRRAAMFGGWFRAAKQSVLADPSDKALGNRMRTMPSTMEYAMSRFRSAFLLATPLCLLVSPGVLPSSTAHAATRVVTNCNNSGTGSLRATVAGAASGDLIDLRSLGCSRIVLNGQIPVPQRDLRLLGRNRLALTIDGNRAGRVFAHGGAGTLAIDHLSISKGLSTVAFPYSDEGAGGCIHSPAGTVKLWRSRVHACEAHSAEYMSYTLYGGGIAAANVVLISSSVFNNKAGLYGRGGGISGGSVRLYHSQVYGNAVEFEGGGIFADEVRASYSTIHGNRANRGGGIATRLLTLNKSTVSNNRAVTREFYGGGGVVNEAGGVLVEHGTGHSVVVDSTISGNTAVNHSAGAFHDGSVAIYNSTITDNLENYPEGHYGGMPPEEFGLGALYAPAMRLWSSIVAGNRRLLGAPAYDIAPGSNITGSHNLIGHSRVATPPDTLAITDPGVEPLAYNGGPTKTHAVTYYSRARDSGSNVLNRQYDQRGPGFPRELGGTSDIGSYELPEFEL